MLIKTRPPTETRIPDDLREAVDSGGGSLNILSL